VNDTIACYQTLQNAKKKPATQISTILFLCPRQSDEIQPISADLQLSTSEVETDILSLEKAELNNLKLRF
jgi:hypothetical protein